MIKGCKPIAFKWIYTYKKAIPNVEEPRYKVRLVAIRIHSEIESGL